MRAKIMLLPGNDIGERLCAIAEEVLTDVAVAFGHTFSLLREKIGESSIRAYDTPLTEETVNACLMADAVLLGDTDCAGADTLLQALEIPYRMRTFALKGNGRNCFYLLMTTDTDAATIGSTMQKAFELAKLEDMPLSLVFPSGKSALDFRAALHVRESDFPTVKATELTPPKAVDVLVHAPDMLGVFVVPPYAGSMLCAMATTLHGAPMMLFDACEGKNTSVFAPVVSLDTQADDEINPMGMVFSIARLLRDALSLEREADCVEAAVNNVLAAGWRTPDMFGAKETIGTYKMLQLISDQINLAGEFLTPHGGK